MSGPGDAAGLRGHDELHVVQVTATLLALCRARAPGLDHALQRQHAGGGPFGPYLAAAMAIVPDQRDTADPEYLDRAQLDALAGLLDAATDDDDLAMRARDAATVIDDRRGRHFFAHFSFEVTRCAPGDPVPVTPSDVVVEELGTARGLAPDPDSLEVPLGLGVPLDGTRYLRLCPEGLGKLTVTLDTRHAGAIDTLFSTERIAAPGPDVVWAAVVPSCAVLADLTYDKVDDVEPRAFYRVRPRPEGAAAYRARLLRGLELAAAARASIVVLPELSTDAACEDDVVRWFAATPAVRIVIAGSRHLEHAGDPRRNRARVLLRGAAPGAPLVHDKFSNFELDLEGVRRVEHIERPDVMTIVAGRRWSFAALICKDFMEPTPRRVLADLRVRAILIASMSPKTDLFVTSAGAAAQDGQALVFVSNAPHGRADHTAIFAPPRRNQLVTCHDQVASGLVALVETGGEQFRVLAIHDGAEIGH